MLEADSLAALADDLRALSGPERRAVLAALSPFERAQVAALIEASALPAQPAAPDFSRYSPWLARHLGDKEGGSERNLTPATRRLLAEAAAAPSAAAAPLPPASEPKRRSLLDALTQRLSPRQALR
jgi:hypothetical protein